eukprot:TRINITY_DN10037_c0_g1_i1.p1 TRINITY_DN10037_c0_g1~~TRINITY_DN10037_c0_g1_i1.p1  ORF type:complete len:112 (+),score=9.30 TRINITY_DN10037_c0_g1_i1:211-546(+)
MFCSRNKDRTKFVCALEDIAASPLQKVESFVHLYMFIWRSCSSSSSCCCCFGSKKFRILVFELGCFGEREIYKLPGFWGCLDSSECILSGRCVGWPAGNFGLMGFQLFHFF